MKRRAFGAVKGMVEESGKSSEMGEHAILDERYREIITQYIIFYLEPSAKTIPRPNFQQLFQISPIPIL